MGKPNLTSENRAIINTALRNILAMPETYDQRNWIWHDPRAKPKKGRPEPFCGTRACIAGHIALAAGLHVNVGTWSIITKANEVVGESGDAALFDGMGDNWPARFRKGWSLLSKRKQAKRAVARVRFWMRTGE